MLVFNYMCILENEEIQNRGPGEQAPPNPTESQAPHSAVAATKKVPGTGLLIELTPRLL